MEVLTLLISVVALVVAILAYARTGGIQELRSQVSALGSSTETLRTKTTDTLDSLRAKMADTLDRLEGAVRGSTGPPSTPAEPPRPAPGAVPPPTEEKKKEP